MAGIETARTEIEVANAALLELGGEAISDFDADDPDARTVKSTYPLVRDALLTKYRWNWLKVRAGLRQKPWEGRSSNYNPEMDLPYQWWLPKPDGDVRAPRVTSIRAAYDTSRSRRPTLYGWEIRSGGVLVSDFSPVWVEYQRTVTVPEYPAVFLHAFFLSLAARFAIAIFGDEQLKREYENEAKEEIRNALRVDAQSSLTPRITEFSFIRARHEGFRPSGGRTTILPTSVGEPGPTNLPAGVGE